MRQWPGLLQLSAYWLWRFWKRMCLSPAWRSSVSLILAQTSHPPYRRPQSRLWSTQRAFCSLISSSLPGVAPRNCGFENDWVQPSSTPYGIALQRPRSCRSSSKNSVPGSPVSSMDNRSMSPSENLGRLFHGSSMRFHSSPSLTASARATI